MASGGGDGRGRSASTYFRRAVDVSYRFCCRRRAWPQAQVLEEHLLLAGGEAQIEPAEDVVHDRLGEADVGIAAPAAGLEAGVGKLLAQQFQRHAVLQSNGDGAGEAVHEAADRRSLFGHSDEDFAHAVVGIKSDGDVALMSAYVEFVSDRSSFSLQFVAYGAWRSVEIFFFSLRRRCSRIALLRKRCR